ncbi:sigma-70 family RNA polymerase sigma factor [Oceanobacillus chungangensis]|uniref:RNA polymerase subunit sigma n=1 Tax=Oceanobacillus chungangensis TaxID=1229152 RepID=A0A3D8PX24_9BACI|nr:sigma-70 family RNA polymerase sigma factor [Oceanobacillus chungangensis]RDW20643.1 RNA polymerase subunit sigma [Oceanobacillus chungangensis]
MINEPEISNSIGANELILNELINLYGDELKRIAFLYVNDLTQCEDIIQEVFISCYNNLNKFKNQSSYKTWLYRITINKCKDYQKKWSFKNIVYKPLIKPVKNYFTESPQTVYENEEDSNQIIDAISQLSFKYKEVLIMFYYQEMTMKEISEVCSIKINTVKSRLTRGRMLLKSDLERRGYNYE